MMRVILDRRVERRRWEGQSNVAVVVDRIDTFRFRVRPMPIRPRIKMPVGGISRNLHDEVRVLIRARSNGEDSFFVDLLCPFLGSIEP